MRFFKLMMKSPTVRTTISANKTHRVLAAAVMKNNYKTLETAALVQEQRCLDMRRAE
jgi:hypothetical protein